MGDLIILRLRRLYHIVISLGILAVIGHHNLTAVKFVDNHVQAADVICVRMGADDVIQMVDTLIFQIGLYLRTLAVVACVDKHSVIALPYQGAVALPDIQIMDLQGRSVGYGCAARLFCKLFLHRVYRRQYQRNHRQQETLCLIFSFSSSASCHNVLFCSLFSYSFSYTFPL